MISIFSCLDKSSKPIKTLSVQEVLELIKSNPKANRIAEAKFSSAGGKYNELKPFKAYSKQRGGTYHRNLYNEVKSKEIWAVTWNCLIKDRRAIKNIEMASGYIYGDIDNFDKIIEDKTIAASTVEEAQAYVWKLLTGRTYKFVKAVWRSFGGGGFGFIMKVDGLQIGKDNNNFKSTWKSLESMFAMRQVIFDKATKDITRPNVISSDPDIFIRDDSDVKPYVAVEASQKNVKEIKISKLPSGLLIDTLQDTLDFLYNDKDEYWENNRLTYNFYLKYFSFTNHRAITLEEALSFLLEKKSTYSALLNHRNIDEVSYIAEKIYRDYNDQWGFVRVSQSSDISLEQEEEITDVYVEYKGDVNIKLHQIWHNLRNKDWDLDTKLKIYSTIIKKTGIKKELIIDFLCSIDYIPRDNELSIIDSIYRDISIVYGIISKPTEEATIARKKMFLDKAKTEYKEAITRTEYEGCTNTKLDNIISDAERRFPNINNDNIFSFLGAIFYNTKSFAIPYGSVLDYIESKYILSDEGIDNLKTIQHWSTSIINATLRLNSQIVRYARFLAPEIYNFDTWKYGLQLIQRLSPDSVKKRYNITKEYVLKKGEHISDLNLKVDKDVIYWGNTSQGKTTWICEHLKGKRLVLVPIIPLLKGIQHSHNASVYWQNGDTVQEGDDLIVCTYSSFKNLLNKMEKWENVKVTDYDLFFDEYHNNAASSDPSFRGYELNYIIDKMYAFKSRTMLTGTMFPILHPVLEKFEIIRVNWEKVPPKKFKRIRYEDKLYALPSKLSRDGKNIIYLQNKKKELDKLLDILTSPSHMWDRNRIWIINADEKNSEAFVKLITNERIDDDIDILICTSVIIEGVNIYNEDIATIHFMSHEGIINSEQMVNRFREVYKGADPSCMIYIYKKIDDKPHEKTDQLDVVAMQKYISELAKKQLEFISNAYTSEDSLTYKTAQKIFLQSVFKNSAFYRNNNGKWEINYLSITNASFKEEKVYSYQDIDFTIMMLEEYNWQFYGEEVVLGKLTTVEKAMIKNYAQIRADELTYDVQEIIIKIREDGEKKTIDKISDANLHILEKMDRAEYEISLRSKVKWLCHNMDFSHACNLLSEWVDKYNMSDRIWGKIIRQVNVKIAKELDVFNKSYTVTTVFAKSLMSYYMKIKKEEKKTGVKKLMDSTSLIKILKKRVSLASNLEDTIITESVALDVLSDYFDIDRVIDKNQVKYYISGINISNDVSTFSNDLHEWFTKCFQEDVVMSTQELATKLNSLRAKLPILGMYKLNSKNAMRLVHDYYGFERVSRRIVNGKKINIYKFTSDSPQELLNVTIKPLRNVKINDKHISDMTYDEKRLFNHQTKINSLTYYINMNNKEEVLV